MSDRTDSFDQTRGFLAGLVIGGLAGAGAALLLAPQSGEKTRDEIQKAGIKLRDQAVDGLGTMEHEVAQARRQADQVATDLRQKAGKFQKQAREVLDDQKERLTSLVEGK